MKGLEDLSFSTKIDQLQYSQTSRPSLKGNVDFDISHSGHMVGCAISKEIRLGFDVEKIVKLDISDYKTLFTNEEWQDIITAQDSLYRFYYYWTIMESILKAHGAGLGNTSNLSIINGHEAFLLDSFWEYTSIFLYKGYVCYLSYEKVEVPIKVQVIFV